MNKQKAWTEKEGVFFPNWGCVSHLKRKKKKKSFKPYWQKLIFQFHIFSFMGLFPEVQKVLKTVKGTYRWQASKSCFHWIFKFNVTINPLTSWTMRRTSPSEDWQSTCILVLCLILKYLFDYIFAITKTPTRNSSSVRNASSVKDQLTLLSNFVSKYSLRRGRY